MEWSLVRLSSSEEISFKKTLCQSCLIVYSTHAATDTSATKDESWVENGDGHETYQTSVPVMDDLRA